MLDTLQIAKSWLHECTQDHSQWQCANQDSDMLPTRLVCIANPCPRLVSTCHWTARPRYATLSHCWGDVPFLRLETRNQDAFSRIIPSDQLPKTFQDAIEIAKALGLEYIWIDSLCIVQDDDDDWRKEAALMSSVYGGSHVNIAASSATSAHQGCYKRTDRLVDGLQVEIHIQGERRELKVIQFEEVWLYDTTVWRSHLAGRAWAFQEKILSPRTIHSGDCGMFWECAGKVASEMLPCGLNPISLQESPIRQYQELQRDSYLAWWANAIDRYSNAKLTYGRDKLVAISGIARQIHDRFGDTYIAGLWHNPTIEEQLCWKVEPFQLMTMPKPRLKPRPAYRAPSWSWASIDSAIELDDLHLQRYRYQNYARVLDAKTYPVGGQDQFGQISAGWIRIACKGLLYGRLSTRKSFEVDCPGGGVTFDIEPDTVDDVGHMECHGAYVLPMILGTRGPEASLRRSCSGILLRPSEHTHGQFHRCGGFKVPSRCTGFSELIDEMFKPWQPLAQRMCAEIIGDTESMEESFVITII